VGRGGGPRGDCEKCIQNLLGNVNARDGLGEKGEVGNSWGVGKSECNF
jgi:hypothetical protein